MLILFDQGTPVPLAELLAPHQVRTAFEHGWNTLTNGALLDQAEADGFAVLVTTDQNLRHQRPRSPFRPPCTRPWRSQD